MHSDIVHYFLYSLSVVTRPVVVVVVAIIIKTVIY